MKHSQHGYVDLGPGWLWALVDWLALVGVLGIIGAAGWGLWWLATHVRFV